MYRVRLQHEPPETLRELDTLAGAGGFGHFVGELEISGPSSERCLSIASFLTASVSPMSTQTFAESKLDGQTWRTFQGS